MYNGYNIFIYDVFPSLGGVTEVKLSGTPQPTSPPHQIPPVTPSSQASIAPYLNSIRP
jgi:hypothetical protein